jgi:hypothetical protein
MLRAGLEPATLDLHNPQRRPHKEDQDLGVELFTSEKP